MVLGESAAVAAHLAIAEGRPVQQVDAAEIVARFSSIFR
jgi:hypothetical protein